MTDTANVDGRDRDADLLLEWAHAGATDGTVTRQQFIDSVREWAADYGVDDPWAMLAERDDAPQFAEASGQ